MEGFQGCSMAGSGGHGSKGGVAAAAAAPEDQAYPPHLKGSAWQAARAGLGSTAGPEAPEAGAAPGRERRQAAPTLCLRAGLLPPKKNRTVCPWPVGLSQAVLEELFLGRPLCAARTLECIHYFMCCVFYSWIHLIFSRKFAYTSIRA